MYNLVNICRLHEGMGVKKYHTYIAVDVIFASYLQTIRRAELLVTIIPKIK
jgi:hypothetical protein